MTIDVVDVHSADPRLPGLLGASLPIPHLVSPYAGVLEEHLHGWVRRHGLVRSEAAARRFDAARFGYFAACVYPTAPNPAPAAEWVTWLFMFDDQFDDGPLGRRPDEVAGLLSGLRAVLPVDLRPVSPPAGLAAALAGIWAAVAPAMTPAWRRRFVRHAGAYLDSYRQEAVNRRHGRPPDLPAYIELRRATGAVPTCLDMIEVAAGFSLPPALAGSHGYRALALAANDIICWTNDILSVDKELARGEVNNLVLVLRHATGRSLPASVRCAVDMLAGRWRDFLAAAAALPLAPDDGPELAYCVAAMKQWIAGSLHWHQSSARYREVHRTVGQQRPDYLDDLVRVGDGRGAEGNQAC
jgi:hypothetical protein